MVEAAADNPSSTLRLFVALQVPAETKHALGGVQASLKDCLKNSNVSWTGTHQMHLTLRFLGSMDGQRLPQLTDVLTRSIAGSGRFNVRAEGLGFFPNARRARVVWTGLSGDTKQLMALQAAVEASVGLFSTRPEEHSFNPHLTLARIKSLHKADVRGLEEAAGNMLKQRLGEWQVTEAHLFSSVLGPGGATHHVLATFPL